MATSSNRNSITLEELSNIGTQLSEDIFTLNDEQFIQKYSDINNFQFKKCSQYNDARNDNDHTKFMDLHFALSKAFQTKSDHIKLRKSPPGLNKIKDAVDFYSESLSTGHRVTLKELIKIKTQFFKDSFKLNDEQFIERYCHINDLRFKKCGEYDQARNENDHIKFINLHSDLSKVFQAKSNLIKIKKSPLGFNKIKDAINWLSEYQSMKNSITLEELIKIKNQFSADITQLNSEQFVEKYHYFNDLNFKGCGEHDQILFAIIHADLSEILQAQSDLVNIYKITDKNTKAIAIQSLTLKCFSTWNPSYQNTISQDQDINQDINQDENQESLSDTSTVLTLL